MASNRVDRAAIEALVEILDERRLTEIEYESGGLRLRVARSGAVQPVPAGHVPIAPVEEQRPDAPAEGTEPPSAEAVITSPMVGTFYVASAPDSPPFVDVGARVRKGQVVCIIEAMKLMNEIESEHDGVISECLVENAQAVEYGQPLFRLEPA